MPTRNLTFFDINPTSRILAAAFFDDSLVGDYVHPYRKQYPDGVRLFQRQGLRSTFYSGPDHVHLVTYDTAGGKEQITGYAHWIRKRATPRPQTLYQRFMTIVMSVYNFVESIVLPDRAMEPSRAGIFGDLDALIKHHLVGHRRECWYLALLAVDPNAHKSGQGRQLLTWGLDRGKEEGIPVGLVSSPAGEGFYRHCGFKVELGRIGSWLGDRNPLKDVAGGEVFFTE